MNGEKYPYQKEWEDYRTRKLLAVLAFIGFIPFGVLAFWLLNFLDNGEVAENIRLSLFVVYIVIVCGVGLRYQFWKCPRCEKSFHTKFLYHNTFSSKCLHCKLPKYYGSTYFFDAWGNEEGNEIIEKINDGKL